ncbi:DNA adenine methylase [Trabulsiella guamensis]|uniref:DNA adenine methylase n=1 Tax=Trabulsiella guamensis TaxID=158852 RepID=UPI000570DAAE|nr:Dam family site-specific DNA-(adenine-N6)-methyltransferase [Trabulsiella guamensis]
MVRPFLKWAGGKSRVMPELLQHLPAGGCLTEPFVGGASVFMATDYPRYVLGDINIDLINLYRELTRYPDLVIDTAGELFKNRNSRQDYLEIRAEFNRHLTQTTCTGGGRRAGRTVTAELSRIVRAAQFLYLNRHGYNGLCRYSRKTGFNVPFGSFKKVYFPEEEMRLFAEKARDTKAIFICAPFQRTLKLVTGSSDVIYCDPPYLPVSDTASFSEYFGETFTAEHHRQLVSALLDVNTRLGAQVVISNSDTPETREIYQPFRLHEISVRRSVSADVTNRGEASEVIGVLRVCEGCGRAGGGHCPDCGPVMGNATCNTMIAGSFDDRNIF